MLKVIRFFDSAERSPATSRRWSVLPSALVLTCLLASAAEACNIPVFRYALERWQADACELIVYHDGPLSASEQKSLEDMESRTIQHGGLANIKIIRVPVGPKPDRIKPDFQRDELIRAFKLLKAATLPHVVVRTKIGGRQMVNHWHGSLERLAAINLLGSPVRQELSRRLIAGHSIVWLMLQSSDQDANAKIRKQMEAELKNLSATVKLPEGVGLPGSELHSEVPLLVRFSLLEIDPQDSRERFLVDLLTGFYPEAVAKGECLLIPVFGRGRALEVIPDGDLDPQLTRDLTMFLSAACSCQVKDQNPGFDLLMATDWDNELFGEDGARPPAAKSLGGTTTPGDSGGRPLLLTIPPGRNN